VAGLHDDDDYRPVYSNVPGKGLVIVTADYMSYFYAIVITVPVFGLFIVCHFLIRERIDRFLKKKRDIRAVDQPDFRVRPDIRQRVSLYKPGVISRQYDQQV